MPSKLAEGVLASTDEGRALSALKSRLRVLEEEIVSLHELLTEALGEAAPLPIDEAP